jgi:hypothetical protein
VFLGAGDHLPDANTRAQRELHACRAMVSGLATKAGEKTLALGIEGEVRNLYITIFRHQKSELALGEQARLAVIERR